MSISELLQIFRRHLPVLIALPLLGVLCAAAVTMTTTPKYRATSSVYFSLPYGDSAVDLSQGSTYTQAQIESYSVLATSPRVLQMVADAVPFDTTVAELRQEIATSSASGTVILRISATTPSAVRAAQVANETATQLGVVARELSPKDAKGHPTVEVTTVGKAKVPTMATTPRTKLNLAAGLLIGLVLGVVWAMLREKLDTKVRSAEDLAFGDVPSLGVVDIRKGEESYIDVVDAPMGAGAEKFRWLRTNLRFTNSDQDSSFALTVTSASAGEGKSTIALNLASAYAEAGQRVLLIDADLRRPIIADRLDLEGAVGLSTVLSGQAPFEEVVQPLGGDSTLDVLASGVVPPNPTQLLGSPKMQQLMESVCAIYDVVIVDSPPVGAVTDAALIGPLTFGYIVAVRQGRTHIGEVRETLTELGTLDAPVVGTVLGRRARRFRSADSYTYGPYGGSGRSGRQTVGRLTRRQDRQGKRHRRPARSSGGVR